MKSIQISERDYEILDRVLRSNELRDPSIVVRDLIRTYAPGLIQSQTIVMDLNPAENGANHSQKQWIELYNTQRGEFRGKRMISAPDFIRAPEKASPEAVASLQKDCLDSWVVTSSHISYQPDTLAGNITHNYQSLVAIPKLISLDEIPVFQGESARKIIETAAGRSYLKALADERYAKPSTLLNRLVALSKREPENITFWTPKQSSRALYQERAVWFDDIGQRFHVNGILFDNSVGHSRGALINPRSGRA